MERPEPKLYVLPNRKAFSDSITRIFIKSNFRDTNKDQADEEEDLCRQRGGPSNSRELFTYQKLVRDYLLMDTPYRGLLLYHGLGSGKTCSSIAVSESLMSTKKVYILLPASLQANYRAEIRKCGDPIYAFEQYWEERPLRSAEDREEAIGFGITQTLLDKNGKYFITVPDRQPNFRTLPATAQKLIRDQIDDILDSRFNFINYNGLSSTNVDSVLPPDQTNMFDDSVVIIDEAHNLIGSVVNDRIIKAKLYQMIYKSKNTKVVCLSGTPIINRPNEIAFLMNLLRGPIDRISIPTKSAMTWDEAMMTAFFRSIRDVDTIEYNSVKRTFMLTRNPPYFESQYNDKGERIAVKFNKDFIQEPDMKVWVSTWKTKFEEKFAGQRWEALSQKGANKQRPLWASTGVKDPAYPDTQYVIELIAPDTVNTMPQSTLDALIDHGDVRGNTISGKYPEAVEVLKGLSALGISLDQITTDLEVDGVKKFAQAWDELLENVKAAQQS
jgi:hypothetical protein